MDEDGIGGCDGSGVRDSGRNGERRRAVDDGADGPAGGEGGEEDEDEEVEI